MRIGQIGGGVQSLQAPSRRAPAAALALRDDGRVALIDVRAEGAERVRWVWAGRGCPPAAAVGWMTAEVPAVVDHDGRLYTLGRGRGGKMAVIGSEDCGRTPRPPDWAMITRQQCPAAGAPFAVTVDGGGAFWWGLSEDLEPVFDGFHPWPDGPRAVALPGSVVPWADGHGFVKLVDGGSFAGVSRVLRVRHSPVLEVAELGTVTVGTDPYRVVGAFAPARGTGVDVALARRDRIQVIRVREGRPLETQVTELTPEPGWAITSADFRNGFYLVSLSGPGGGAVRLIDPVSGRRMWQFDLDVGVQDVLLLHDGRRTRALAVDDDGDVHLWTVGWDADPAGSTPASPPAGGGGVALRSIDLD